jgi:hypothetical protein
VATVSLTVTGLQEFSRSVSQLAAAHPRALRIAQAMAGELVADTARPRVPTLTGAAAHSIRPRPARSAVEVSAGGPQASYYPWLDFGGRVGRHGTAQRAFLKEGRYLYPAYFERRRAGDFDRILEAQLLRVAKAAGLAVE